MVVVIVSNLVTVEKVWWVIFACSVLLCAHNVKYAYITDPTSRIRRSHQYEAELYPYDEDTLEYSTLACT